VVEHVGDGLAQATVGLDALFELGIECPFGSPIQDKRKFKRELCVRLFKWAFYRSVLMGGDIRIQRSLSRPIPLDPFQKKIFYPTHFV
jgi:hypothetical protein